MTGVQHIIDQLRLIKHPEGGYYAETFRHPQTISLEDGRVRNLGTTIYFLLQGKDRSHFHRLLSDETWFFHSGSPIELVMLANGAIETFTLGPTLSNSEFPQLLIPANTWFAARVKGETGYGLVSCTVTPGFDFDDFELATAEKLRADGYKLDDALLAFLI